MLLVDYCLHTKTGGGAAIAFEVDAKTDTSWKRNRRTPKTDDDPSNQFWFTFRKRLKYEKAHDWKVCSYL